MNNSNSKDTCRVIANIAHNFNTATQNSKVWINKSTDCETQSMVCVCIYPKKRCFLSKLMVYVVLNQICKSAKQKAWMLCA